MAGRTCPHWVGYLLLNPLRRLLENPDKLLGGFVTEGMTVLEPGCGMGYFTLPLARMVGAKGRVIAVDIQPKMLAGLSKRAQKAGLSDRIEIRRAASDGLGVEDLAGQVDFVAAIHMVHEMPDARSFLSEVRRALKSGGRILVVEPKGHVSKTHFAETLAAAEQVGFQVDPDFSQTRDRKAVLVKPGSASRST
jgi:ubiquinone/menaquinone biosynthesis C-methylase UbiE